MKVYVLGSAHFQSSEDTFCVVIANSEREAKEIAKQYCDENGYNIGWDFKVHYKEEIDKPKGVFAIEA